MQLGSGNTLVVETDHWSSLPRDILGLIADNLGFIEDYVGLSTVCRSWHVHAAGLYPLMRYKLRFGPYYMYGTNYPRSGLAELRRPASDETLTVVLPESHRIWGSPLGWLITFHPENRRFSLLNPLTGATTPLPPLPKSKSKWLTSDIKAFLTANPDGDLIIIVSGFRKSSFVSPGRGSKDWSCLNADFLYVTCFQGNLYGIRSSGIDKDRLQVVLIQLNHHPTPHRFVPIVSLDTSPHISVRYHLADINGQLCLCARCYDDIPSTTSPFKVFKIDLSVGNLTQLQSLGDHCLFVCNDYTFSCKTSYPPTHHLGYWYFNFSVTNHLYHCHCEGYGSSCGCVDVWDMSCSRKVHKVYFSHFPNPKDLYKPLWILPPVNFRKLEGGV